MSSAVTLLNAARHDAMNSFKPNHMSTQQPPVNQIR
jgi:hypothetical protein